MTTSVICNQSDFICRYACVYSVGAGYPWSWSISLRADHRWSVWSHSAGQCSYAWWRQGFWLDARPLDVPQEGSDAWVHQGDITRRRDDARSTASKWSAPVAARWCPWYGRSPSSERSVTASWSLCRVAAAEKQQRFGQCPCPASSTECSTVCQSARQSKRHQVVTPLITILDFKLTSLQQD